MSDHTQVIVDHLPECDFKNTASPCKGHQRYDARLRDGRWGNVCEHHFQKYGIGLGLGRGQRLLTQQEVDAQAAVDEAARVYLDDYTNEQKQDAFLAAHRALTLLWYGPEAAATFGTMVRMRKRTSPLDEAIARHPAGKGREE